MVSIELSVSIREEDISRWLKWYSLAFKDKHPSKDDEDCYMLLKVLHTDIVKENKEEQSDE
jgi:hypothetical protein